jgi:hypothetical protein
MLPFIHLKEIESHEYESLWLLLKPHRLPRGLNSIVLGIVYHPPGSDDKALLAHLTESIDSAKKPVKNACKNDNMLQLL